MNYTEEQISLAFNKLPRGAQDILFTSEIEQRVQKLGIEAGLSVDQSKKLTSLINFAIMNLVPRSEFSSVVEKELGIPQREAVELTNNISREIFASVEAMEAQAKKEQVSYGVSEKGDTENTKGGAETAPVTEKPKNLAAQMYDVAPDNLPTGEEESFLPKLTPKIIMPSPASQEQEAVHPFEEKMKEFYTAGQQPVIDTVVKTVTPQTFTSAAPAPQAPKAPLTYGADPYREAIE